MSAAENEGDRVVYFDALRVLAIFAVMVLHVASQNWSDVGVDSHEWAMLNLYDGLSRWSVPVLVMISGALFLDRDIPIRRLYGKYILRVLRVFFVWSIGYVLIFDILGQYGLKSFVSSVFKGYYHMWFLYMIAGLYALVPILRRIVSDKKTTDYFLILALVFAVLVPEFIGIVKLYSMKLGSWLQSLVNVVNIKLVLGYTIYFVLGYALSHRALSRRTTAFICILGVLGFVSTVALTAAVSKMKGEPMTLFYSNTSLNVLLEALFVFVLFKRVFENVKLNGRFVQALAALSKYSFGAYLIHALIINLLNRFFGLNSLSFDTFFAVPVLSLIVLVLSFGISALLNKIPMVKKYLI